MSGYPRIEMAPEFKLTDLICGLQAAQMRWEDGGPVTARLEGTGINIYQDGLYRAAIDLDDERPCISHWADDDA